MNAPRPWLSSSALACLTAVLMIGALISMQAAPWTPGPQSLASEDTPAPSPTATLDPAPSSDPPTPTPTPTTGPVPSPTSSPTAEPTTTPTPIPSPTSTPVPTPTFSSRASVDPASIAAGGTVAVAAAVTSATEAAALVDVVFYRQGAPSPVHQAWFDNQSFAAGEERVYPVPWQVPVDAATGTYTVSVGVFAPGWGTLYSWASAIAAFSVTAAPPAPARNLKVSGNRLVDSAGQPVQLRGVNRSSAEYACSQGWGIFDGPTDQAAIDAMRTWKVNAVRVPLNEDCWLAINGVPAAYSGANYQRAIHDYVDLLNRNGLNAIVDLHWSAPGGTPALGAQPMPDVDHSPAFWSDVATAFKGNDAVIFELFNEPYPDDNQDTAAAWSCWRDGGTCPGVPFQAAGMQTLLNAVRATGATNVVALGGVHYSTTLFRWLEYAPIDPLNNVIAAWHVYNVPWCRSIGCDGAAAAVAAQVPLVATEIGTSSCDEVSMNWIMEWLDVHNSGYLAWTWNPWGTACTSIALITDYSGAPTTWGQIYKAHIAP